MKLWNCTRKSNNTINTSPVHCLCSFVHYKWDVTPGSLNYNNPRDSSRKKLLHFTAPYPWLNVGDLLLLPALCSPVTTDTRALQFNDVSERLCSEALLGRILSLICHCLPTSGTPNFYLWCSWSWHLGPLG